MDHTLNDTAWGAIINLDKFYDIRENGKKMTKDMGMFCCSFFLPRSSPTLRSPKCLWSPGITKR